MIISPLIDDWEENEKRIDKGVKLYKKHYNINPFVYLNTKYKEKCDWEKFEDCTVNFWDKMADNQVCIGKKMKGHYTDYIDNLND